MTDPKSKSEMRRLRVQLQVEADAELVEHNKFLIGKSMDLLKQRDQLRAALDRAVEGFKQIKSFSQKNHMDQEKALLFHSLAVEIPYIAEQYLRTIEGDALEASRVE